MRLRFSLRQLLGFVAFVAVGCGGLMRPSVGLASLIFTATLVVLLVAILGAVGRKGTARVFWIGFAIAGSGYLWMAHWADEESYTVSTNWRLQTTGPLLTTKLLALARDALHPPPQGYPPVTGFFASPLEPRAATVFGQMGGIGGMGGRRGVGRPTQDPAAAYEAKMNAFMRIGHSLWALVFAYLGGQLARYFRTTAEDPGGA